MSKNAIYLEYSDFKALVLNVLKNTAKPPLLIRKGTSPSYDLFFSINGVIYQTYTNSGTISDYNTWNPIVNSVYRVDCTSMYLSNNSNDIDMNVNGSITPQEFKISASANYNTLINKITIRIKDSKIDKDRYGFVNLTSGNGVNIILTKNSNSILIFENVKSIYQFINDGFSFEVSTDSKNSFFKYEFFKPLLLSKGSTDKLSLFVRDDLTGLDNHYALVNIEKVYV